MKKHPAGHSTLDHSQPQKILLKGSSSNSIPEIPRVAPSRTSRPIPAAVVETSNSDLIAQISERIAQHGLCAQDLIPPSKPGSIPAGRGSGTGRGPLLGRGSGNSHQPKNKGPLGTPFKGPYATKYNWKRGSTVGPIKKIVKEAVPLKRKNSACPIPVPIKKLAGKGKEKEAAAVALNPDGFYEVKVTYDHISTLAAGCGFTIKEVEKAIQTDNEQRQLHAASHAADPSIPKSTAANLGEDDLGLERFDPDSEDELTSDEGAY